LPVIARDIFEFKEIFGDSVLFFGDLDDARVLVNNDAALRRCASRARASTENYDITLIAQRHQQLYRELIEA